MILCSKKEDIFGQWVVCEDRRKYYMNVCYSHNNSKPNKTTVSRLQSIIECLAISTAISSVFVSIPYSTSLRFDMLI